MPVKFQDYYETLGVARTASQDEVQRAYRKLAKQYHPDTNKAPDAEKRIKQINEAYEVLKDADKRQQYDKLGATYKNGQEFRPPPGYENMNFDFRGPGGAPGTAPGGGGGFKMEGADFSDFFEMFFGRSKGASGARGGARRAAQPQAGGDVEAEVSISVEDAYRGAQRDFSLQAEDGGRRTLKVKIPAGVTDDAVIRLKGQGGEGVNGGPAGDVLLRVKLAPHPRFSVDGRDLTLDVKVTSWEAALGAKVDLPLFEGTVTLTIPPGAQSGQKMRLRGKGLPARGAGGESGDLYVRIMIAVPKVLTDGERELFEKLRSESTFDPRA